MTAAIVMTINSSLESEQVLRHVFSLFSLYAFDPVPVEVRRCHQSRTLGEMEDVIRAKILRSPLITCCYSEDREVAYLNVHNTRKFRLGMHSSQG